MDDLNEKIQWHEETIEDLNAKIKRARTHASKRSLKNMLKFWTEILAHLNELKTLKTQ